MLSKTAVCVFFSVLVVGFVHLWRPKRPRALVRSPSLAGR